MNILVRKLSAWTNKICRQTGNEMRMSSRNTCMERAQCLYCVTGTRTISVDLMTVDGHPINYCGELKPVTLDDGEHQLGFGRR